MIPASPFLAVADVAERLRCSTRTIHELTRTHRIPHFKLSGSRRCLFRPDELERWENGAELEVVQLRNGGRIVRPTESGSTTPGTEQLPGSRGAAQ